MQFLYGYDVAADLRPETPLRRGGRGARAAAARRSPTRDEIGPALDRAFAAGVPYLVNVITDPDGRLPPHHDRGLIARAAAQQIRLSRSYGFTCADSPPLFHHSKCRWLIPGLPVSPIRAITSPAAKRSPARTRCLELCP